MTALRFGTWAAYISAAGFLAMSIDSIVHPGSLGYRDAIILIPLLGGVGALTALHHLQRGRVRFERHLYLLNVVAIAIMLAATGVRIVADPAAARPLFMVPALGWIAGNIAYGVITLRARIMPPIVGVLLIACQPATMMLGVLLKPVAGLHDFGSYSGAIGNACAFGAIGVALATKRMLDASTSSSVLSSREI
jgi:hypothetical protein